MPPLDTLGTDSLLQATEITTQEALPRLSIFELFFQGGVGGTIINLILLALSILTVYVFLERYSKIKKEMKRDQNFLLTLKDFLKDQKIDSAIDLCKRQNTALGELYQQGIKHLDQPSEILQSKLERTANQLLHQMEGRISWLSTISGAAPMLGFLGTVIGMILVFFRMASAGGQIKIDILSNGMYTAMTTTVAGLIVGLLAFVCYHSVAGKIQHLGYRLEQSCDEFVDIVEESKPNSYGRKI